MWGCFLMYGVKILHFWKIDGNPFQFTKTKKNYGFNIVEAQ